ncbi:hypothetical protein ABT381_00320 [Streptomyces sp. NPDC000151]|uniref:hypothetical protein n=1 Tax=Streptomyces sp. NPDC000151 TaxID=3154244 RepID=UPI00332AB4C2
MTNPLGQLRDTAFTALDGKVDKNTVFTVMTAEGGPDDVVTARAPQGFRVISGGFNFGHPEFSAKSSHPTDDGKGWVVEMKRESNLSEDGSWSKAVQVYAVCIRMS